jgi:tetratricopeptide (TPR) repeat protein
MRAFILAVMAALLTAVTPAAAQSPKRVALVIGNSAYQTLTRLHNPRIDAGRFAGILAANGFEVLSCDGQRTGCFDLARTALRQALDTLQRKADGADLVLVFYAGHGMQLSKAEGGVPPNVLAPVDLEFDCDDPGLTGGVPLEEVFAALSGARQRIVILDACRNDPFEGCQRRRTAAAASFGVLTLPDAESFLLVSSTKPGQTALDGIDGEHSPFARALFEGLRRSPDLYFHQLLQLHVAKAVIEITGRAGFTQVPETLTRGIAPDACLKGLGCAADDRAGALQQEVERLRSERSRDQVAETFLALKEKGLSRQLSPEERRRELEGLHQVVRELAAQNDTRSEEALARMQAGDAEGAKRLYAEVLEAREKEAAEIEKQAAARATAKRREAAKAARSLAALERLANVGKAVELYKRATELDPADAEAWLDYARAAFDTGRFADAKSAVEQAIAKSDESANATARYWATSMLGVLAMNEGSLTRAEQLYKAALAMVQAHIQTSSDETVWRQRQSFLHSRIGAVLRAQGKLGEALESYKTALAIAERLPKTDAGDIDRQDAIADSHDQIGQLLQARGNLDGALESYRIVLAIIERLANTDVNNTGRLQTVAVSHDRIGSVLQARGDLDGALEHYRTALATMERLVKTDVTNARWQSTLWASHGRIGAVLQAQGNPDGALESYRTALAISERWNKEATNTIWQNTLKTSHRQIAEVLQSRGDLRGAAQSYKAALAITEQLTGNTESEEIKQGGKAGANTAAALGSQAWHALLARAFESALAASERAHTLAPDLVWLESNRAHALMFLNRSHEARALYLAHKGKSLAGGRWEQVIADDFKQLRAAGLSHTLMPRVEKELGVAASPAAKVPGRRAAK